MLWKDEVTMKTRLLALSLTVFLAIVPTAMANMSYGDGGLALTNVLNNITTAPVAGDTSVDVVTDPIADGQDAYWHITATGGSLATMIIEVAGLQDNNTFGVYDAANKGNYVQLFTGAQGAGQQATLSIHDDGEVWANLADTGVKFNSAGWFGYYLGYDPTKTGTGTPVWYSDTALNGGEDHMVAIQGTNTDTVKLPGMSPGVWTDSEFVLAWEDLPFASSDRDYDDMVLMVESVKVPVPAALLLGFLGLGAAGLKLRRFA